MPALGGQSTDLTDINVLSRTSDVKRLLVSPIPSARTRRRLLLVALVLAGWGLTPVAARADGTSTTVTSPIRAGNDGHVVGSATFTRTRTSSGQRLAIVLTVDGGISSSHVCVSDHAFTAKNSPGQCPYTTGAAPSSVSYDIDLGSATGTVYVQAHVFTAQGESAYAGWHAGNPFYGNLAIADPGGDGTPVPIGAVGALLLSTAVAGGVAVRRVGRR
jgi:hypothetical protein